MIKHDAARDGEIVEHEYYDLPENDDDLKRPPNIRDVGIPLSNTMSCTMRPQDRNLYMHLNNNPKVFTAESLTGFHLM
jgi:hypothetical protein